MKLIFSRKLYYTIHNIFSKTNENVEAKAEQSKKIETLPGPDTTYANNKIDIGIVKQQK